MAEGHRLDSRQRESSIDRLLLAETEASPVPLNRTNFANMRVMGAGVALAFKLRYPEMFKEYQRACQEGVVRPGALHVWKNLTGDWVVNFPTKRDWRDPSRYEDVSAGLEALRTYLRKQGSVSVALPAIGFGHGGLDWTRVSNMIEEKLGDLEAQILVFEPADSRAAGLIAQNPLLSSDDLRALEDSGFRPVTLPDRRETSAPASSVFAKGDASILASPWISLLSSKAPAEAEQTALRAIAKQMATALEPVSVAMVHAGRATEDIAKRLSEAGVRVVLILPFGPLTKKKIGQSIAGWPSERMVMISVASPAAAWSRSLFARSMSLLPDGSSSVLISDPNPDWLTGRFGHVWTERPMFYLRYGSLSDKVCRTLRHLGAEPIGRRADTGEPRIHALFDAAHISGVYDKEEDYA